MKTASPSYEKSKGDWNANMLIDRLYLHKNEGIYCKWNSSQDSKLFDLKEQYELQSCAFIVTIECLIIIRW